MAVSSYDEIAEWYDGWITDPIEIDPPFQMVEGLLSDVCGRRVCDLACSQGRVARRLADLGAHVIGIDRSAPMLAFARRRENAAPRGISYLRDDAQHLASIASHAFDGVLCHMALMDIPSLVPTVRSVVRLLRPNGWFVFSILHPCYNTALSVESTMNGRAARLVSGYFTEGYWRSEIREGPPGRVGSYHRTLSTYLNTLIGAGLIIERTSEVQATGDFAEARPVWVDVPATLAIRCRRTSGLERAPRRSQEEHA